jgi:hypothetical protein
MKNSKIGIFYMINGRIVVESVPVEETKSVGAVRSCPREHYEFWSELQKKDPDLRDLDCYALPRGQVRYDDKKKKFEVVADRHILEKDKALARIIQEFGLEESEVEFQEDGNYRCSTCKNDQG